MSILTQITIINTWCGLLTSAKDVIAVLLHDDLFASAES